MSTIENFEALLASGRDNALLRYALANEYAKVDELAKACEHLDVAVRMDPNYSAAWKLLGKTRAALGETAAAATAYQRGIEVAESNGD